MTDDLVAAAIGLLANPNIGRSGAAGGTRELIQRTLRYVLVYEVADDLVRILKGVEHGGAARLTP